LGTFRKRLRLIGSKAHAVIAFQFQVIGPIPWVSGIQDNGLTSCSCVARVMVDKAPEVIANGMGRKMVRVLGSGELIIALIALVKTRLKDSAWKRDANNLRNKV